MTLDAFVSPFPWYRYSKKLVLKIDKLRCTGIFTPEESAARDMFLAVGFSGDIENGNYIKLYWLVDKEDGIIVDAKFQAFGQTALLGAAEVACEVLIGKNYDQAKRVSALLLDQQVRDKPDLSAFPFETSMHINLVLEAIELAAEQCVGIPLASTYVAMPAPMEIGEVLEGGYPGWTEMPTKQKVLVIEEVLDRDIRPYIALDAGGVSVVELVNDHELIISYQGSCTSCYSSVGTTLSYIQQMLRAKVHPSLVVTPDLQPRI